MCTDLVGQSDAARHLKQEISDAARTDAKVLLTGESGVGKEVAARLIHQQSRRGSARMVALNCAAVPDSLLESELFGHVRGSFTGAYRDKPGLLELAHRGVIFLDEIGEMSIRMQALLLRFLESGELWRVGADRIQATSNARVIAATNRDLQERTQEREFRADLFYRLNVLNIRVPPLRERRDDILLLLEHFLQHYAQQHTMPVPELSAAARAAFVRYDWPGNIRELKNMVERLVVCRRSTIVDLPHLPRELIEPTEAPPPMAARDESSRRRADELYERIVFGGASFWTVVRPLFAAHDLTRDDVRGIVERGLVETRGNYRQTVALFNMPAEDYKSFMGFLRKYHCHVPFFKFRCASPARDAEESTAARRVDVRELSHAS